MSGCSSWTFDAIQLRSVLGSWRELRATALERNQVADCILDVLRAPTERGDFDPELTVWVARAHRTNVVFVYELRESDCVIVAHRIGRPDGFHSFPVEAD